MLKLPRHAPICESCEQRRAGLVWQDDDGATFIVCPDCYPPATSELRRRRVEAIQRRIPARW